MPGIFIGIGGIGGAIVSGVRDSLDVKVSLAGDTPSAREAAEQFRFMLLDTWKDGVSGRYDAAQVFDVPEGKDKFEVDAKIDSWWRGGDPAFRSWWPERRAANGGSGAPQLAGPYASGAGQLRVKGKLAYRIALTGLGRPIVPEVMNNLRAINAVLGPAPGIRTVPVYIVCSLGGGSGSGMALTLAQHLRQTLPEYCPIIGVFPLASVTDLGPGAADTSSVWANTDSALREIDYCQRVAGTPENKLTPFFQWPGQGNVIYGKQRPFEYIYLFGRENQSGQSLKEFTEYTDLIAETLIAESFSSLIDEGLQSAILGPHSQFIMQLQARPEIGGRPTSYASAAVASLVFPVDRVERHLAKKFAIDVLARMTDEDDSIVASEVDGFMLAHKLGWKANPSFGTEFDKPITERPSGRPKPKPQFTSQLVMTPGGPFAKANAATAASMAEAARKQLDDYAGKGLQQHYRQRSQEIAEAYSGPNGYLRLQVEKWLADGGPAGLGLAYEAVTKLREALEDQWKEVNKAYEGNEEDNLPGIKRTLMEAQTNFSNAANSLNRQFGSGTARIFDRNGLKPKQRLLQGPFRTLVDRTTDEQRMLAARQAYRDLVTETVKVQRALREIKTNADLLRDELVRETQTDVGEHGQAGVLDLSVLDDPQLLAHHFGDLLDETRRQGVDTTATLVTAPPKEANDPLVLESTVDAEGAPLEGSERLATTGVVFEEFRRLLNPKIGSTLTGRERFHDQLENAIVSDGVNRLGRRVREMSIWDALAAECQARSHLHLHDATVEQSRREIEAMRENAEDAGVPARDWEYLILQSFIRRRLEQCQKRVRPFWNLNGLMTANYGQPYHFVVLATDRKAYEIAETTHGIKGFLDGVSKLMQAGTPKWLPGQDRIVLYSREGVAPLFYLDDRELKRMRDSSAQKGGEKFLYTDTRFEGVVDDVIRPTESADDRLFYAIGMALELGLLQFDDMGRPNGDALRLHVDGGPHSFAGFAPMRQALDRDPSLAHDLLQAVRVGLEGSRRDQYATQQRAQQKVTLLLQNAPNDTVSQPDVDVLNLVQQALQHRMDYGQYELRFEDPVEA